VFYIAAGIKNPDRFAPIRVFGKWWLAYIKGLSAGVMTFDNL